MFAVEHTDNYAETCMTIFKLTCLIIATFALFSQGETDSSTIHLMFGHNDFLAKLKRNEPSIASLLPSRAAVSSLLQLVRLYRINPSHSHHCYHNNPSVHRLSKIWIERIAGRHILSGAYACRHYVCLSLSQILKVDWLVFKSCSLW